MASGWGDVLAGAEWDSDDSDHGDDIVPPPPTPPTSGWAQLAGIGSAASQLHVPGEELEEECTLPTTALPSHAYQGAKRKRGRPPKQRPVLTPEAQAAVIPAGPAAVASHGSAHSSGDPGFHQPRDDPVSIAFDSPLAAIAFQNSSLHVPPSLLMVRPAAEGFQFQAAMFLHWLAA